MVFQQRQLVNNEIYHIVVRGIDDNLLFKDIDDYYRGIFSIYEFNTIQLVTIQKRREIRLRLKKSRDLIPTVAYVDDRDKLVENLVFCLMPNHIHLLLRQIKTNGITKFMQKVGAGYGGYFNRKYGRKGHLFQNRFSSIHIKNDEQLKTTFVYIHTNPISIIGPKWKEIGIKNPDKVIKFLENYKWSSYQDYIGKKNFPSVTERKFISEIMDNEQGCREFVENWVRYKGEIKEFTNLALEW